MANKILLTICQNDYYVKSDQPEEVIRSMAARLDKEIAELMNRSNSVSQTSAAVLLALNYLESSMRESENADNMRTQVKRYLEDSAKSRIECEQYRREVERLREENDRLRSLLNK